MRAKTQKLAAVASVNDGLLGLVVACQQSTSPQSQIAVFYGEDASLGSVHWADGNFNDENVHAVLNIGRSEQVIYSIMVGREGSVQTRRAARSGCFPDCTHIAARILSGMRRF
jgi:hypothetical protein